VLLPVLVLLSTLLLLVVVVEVLILVVVAVQEDIELHPGFQYQLLQVLIR
jgi:hypothetical protein